MMQQSESNIEMTELLPTLGSCCRCHPPFSAYSDLPDISLNALSASKLFQISPLEVGLQIPDGKLISASVFIEYIRQEIALLEPKVRKRPVNLLTIQDAAGLCSNSEFTALMYVLGRNFNLSHGNSKSYTYESSPHRLTEHRLALLTGLGFNHVSIILSPDMDTFDSPLPLDIEAKIRDYGFPRPTVKIFYGDRNSRVAWQQLVNYLLVAQPEKIVTQRLRDAPPSSSRLPPSEGNSEAEHESEQFLLIYTALKENNYRIIGNDCFVRQNHPLIQAQTAGKLWRTINGYNASNVSDCLNLGPGAQSQLGAYYYGNHEDLTLYSRALGQSRSPFWRGLALDDGGLACKQVVDELSCFHETRFSTPMHLYHIDLKPVFTCLDSLYRHLDQYPFWRIRDDVLTLTESGILYLRMICDAVCRELTSEPANSQLY